MTYKIKQFAKLAGVSERTLRYYHEVGLLVPRVEENGYRVYTSADADRMQQILFYRNLEVPLGEIRSLLDAPRADQVAALRDQRENLLAKQSQVQQLIAQVEATLRNEAENMTDEEKFQAFKKDMVAKNDADYGDEVEARYGKNAKREADAQLMGLTPDQFARAQGLQDQLRSLLQEALATQAPADSPVAKRIYAAHRAWLTLMWGKYDPAMHRGLVEMYLEDSRFADYYTKLVGDDRAVRVLAAAVEANAQD
ncbi:MerR family transcriptional regulator [Lacticaseibacillus mingshuiensis]|uniref:MerR family transcriptional regulator n=1 Tax=Lacticaseibacillus mingshuiensis TaxID=2799574 RepID=A0ABW4CDB6_9LACO|nr:MerR family transcriptional regulator [Lacticaseibacillus mingshuiensis]